MNLLKAQCTAQSLWVATRPLFQSLQGKLSTTLSIFQSAVSTIQFGEHIVVLSALVHF